MPAETESSEQSNSIQLGGNIELEGFGHVDRDGMVVVKKMVGIAAKRMSDKDPKFQSLKIILERPGGFNVTAIMKTQDNTNSAQATHGNLYMVLNEVLENVIGQL
ncbi:hypothetical protein ACFL0W_00525 [Nanoarchaeota archaeon]